jgi:hypothetical protein
VNTANYQRFGITVAATGSDSSGTGPSDHYIIADCDVSGYQNYPASSGTGAYVGYGINDRGNGFHKRVSGNIGYNPIVIPFTPFYIQQNGSSTYTQYNFAITPSTPVSPALYPNPFGIDATLLISGGSFTLIAVQGPAGGYLTLPTSTTMVRIPASSYVNLTFTGTPTFTWIIE